MAYIGRGTDKISNIEVLDNITFDGSSSYSITKSSVAFTPNSAQSLLISIDGVVQATNFTVSSSTIDFGVAVPSTSTCDFFLHYGTGLITTPADGTVSNDKLATSVITGQTAETSANDSDSILIYDDSATALRKMTRSNFLTGVGGTNTPAFRVYLNTNTSQTQNTDTKIPYNTEDFDTDNAYDNSSNYRFTPQTSGKYFIQVQVAFDGADANGRVIVFIKKNGSDQSFSSFGIASTADYGGVCQHSDVVTLNGSTDYVEGFVNYTGTDNIRGQTTKTFMLGYRIIE